MAIIKPEQLRSGSYSITGSLFGTSSYAITASYAMNGGSGGSNIFILNETPTNVTTSITANQSIFNPSNLTVVSSSVFFIATTADYYVLGDLINSGSIIVSGSLKVGGALLNSGSITGPGSIT